MSVDSSVEDGPEADLVGVFAALANADRLTILRLLREPSCPNHGMTITEVASRVELSRFSASRHLQILAHAGLITVRRTHGAAFHTLCADTFEHVEDWAYQYAGVSIP